MDISGIEDASFEGMAVGESPYTPLGGQDFATLLADDDRREAGANFGSAYLGEPHANTGLDGEAAAFGDPDLAGISEEELDQ